MALPTFQGVQSASEPPLYLFSSHTFTNCGATGKTGPTLANCKSSYDTSWEGDTELFNVQTQGIQEWTVPTTGTYTIECWGAQGGYDGGLGARMKGDFSLTIGDVIKIIVGQKGISKTSSSSSGRGGGTSGNGGYNGRQGGSFVSSGFNYAHGGGGSSYNSGSNKSNSTNIREDHGQIIITIN